MDMDMNGIVPRQYETTGMLSPVLCLRCGKVYDLCGVKATARYSDATLFTTPCCGVKTDDREFVSSPSFRKLKPEECYEFVRR